MCTGLKLYAGARACLALHEAVKLPWPHSLLALNNQLHSKNISKMSCFTQGAFINYGRGGGVFGDLAAEIR